MEELQPAGQSLDEILNQAKEVALTPDSQPEKEQQPEKVEEEEPQEDERKKNAASRIKELLEERKRDRQEIDAVKSQLEEIKRLKEDTRKPAEYNENVPTWFTKLWGGDPEAWKIYKQGTSSMLEEAKSQAVQEALENFKKIQQEDYNRQQAIEKQLEELREEEKFDKNELKKFMTKYPIFNEDNQFDFKKGLELMKQLKGNSDKSDARKQLLSVNNSNVEQPTREYFTSKDFR